MEDILDFKEYLLFYPVGIFGFCCSVASLIYIYKKPVLHSAFGYICAAHSVAEAGILGIFTLWGAIITISPKEVEKSLVNVIMAHVLNTFYYGALYFHLLKSINRFCAIVFSIKYRIWFSDDIAKLLISMAFIMGFLNTIPLFWYNCNSYFSASTYRFQTRTITCESSVIFFDDFVTCCTTMSIALCCDFITFTYFRIRSQKSNTNSRNDIKLALHACLTTLLYMTMIFSFYMFSASATNIWTTFLSTTFVWMLCHVLNQLSFIIFVTFLQGKSTSKSLPITVRIVNVQRKASEPVKQLIKERNFKKHVLVATLILLNAILLTNSLKRSKNVT